MNHRKRQYTVATEAALILRWKQMRSSGIQYRQASEKKSYEIKISNKKSVSSGNAGLTLFVEIGNFIFTTLKTLRKDRTAAFGN